MAPDNNQSGDVQPSTWTTPTDGQSLETLDGPVYQDIPAPAASSQVIAQPITNQVIDGQVSTNLSLLPKRFSPLAIASSIALVAFLVAGGVLVILLSGSSNKAINYQNTPQPKSLSSASSASSNLQLQSVLVNGQLYVNNGVVLKPSAQPTNPSLGQLYVNDSTKQLSYYNGSSFVSVGSSDSSPADTVLGVSSNLLKLGNGLSISQNTLVNNGITNLLGTQGQIVVAPNTGNATIGLPSSVSIPGSMTAGNFIGNGGSITNLNANNITTGTVSNARLNPDVSLTDRNNQIFTGANQIFRNGSNSTTAFSVQAADGTPELSVDTTDDTLTVNNLLPEVVGAVAQGVTANAIISNTNLDFGGISNEIIGLDGFVQFVYSNYNNNTGSDDLHLVHCTDATCTTYTNQVVVAGTDVNGNGTQGFGLSIALGNDGFAKIAYTYQYEDSSDNYQDTDIDYVNCANADCSTNTQAPIIQSNGDLEYALPAITISSNGLPQIVYGDSSFNGDVPTGLYLASCSDNTCTSTNTTALATEGDSDDLYPGEITIGSDGLLRISYSYYDNNTGQNNLDFIQCTDADCNSPVNTLIDNNLDWVLVPSDLAMGSNGLPTLLYKDGVNGLTYAECTDASCSTSNTTVLDSGGSVWHGLTIAPDGFARVSYINGSDSPAYIDCTNATCSGATPLTVDNTDSNDWGNSIVLGSDGLARIVYSNGNTSTINFALFGTANGQTTTTGTNIGSDSDPFGSIYAAQIHTTGINTSSSGQLLVQGTSNSTNAFTVQDAGGNNLLNVDSKNKTVTVTGGNGGSPTTYTGQVADVGTDNGPWRIVISGNYAYVININSSTLQIFNISNPANPTLISDTNVVDNPDGIAISGNYVYLTGYTSNPMLLAYNVTDPNTPTPAGSVDLSNLYGGDTVDFGDITTSGTTAYLTTTDDNTGNSMLTTYNIADPNNITLEGSVAADQRAQSVAVSGTDAYVTTNSNTLEVFNVLDPTSPSEVADTSTDNCPAGITISGTDAYVVNNCASTLQVFNILNPTTPAQVADVPTDSFAEDIAISGTNAYVTNPGSNTLEVFNIANPLSPSEIADTTTDSDPWRIAISGTDAYVVSLNSNTLQVFDISSSSLDQWGVVTVPPVALQVQGAEAIQPTIDSINTFSIQNASGSTLFDVDTQNGSIGVGGAPTTAGYALNVAGSGSFDSLYVDGSQVCTASNSCGSSINNGTSTQDSANFNIQSASATDVGGVIQGASGQTADLLDLQDDGGDVLDSFNSSGDLGISPSDSSNDALSVDGSATVDGSVNASDALNVGIHAVAPPVTVNNVGTSGNTGYSYVVVGLDGSGSPLTTYPSVGRTYTGNGSLNGTNYNTLSWLPIPGAASYNVYRISVNFGPGGLITNTIVTTANDTGSYTSGYFPSYEKGTSEGLGPDLTNQVTQGEYIYVASSSGDEFSVLDISGPTSPTVVGQVALSGTPKTVAVTGNYAYVVTYASGTDTLYVIDIADSDNPTIVGQVTQSGAPADNIVVSGDYAYIAEYYPDQNINIFDISNPSDPVYVTSTPTTGSSYDSAFVVVSGSYAYVGNGGSTINAYNITDPTDPIFADSIVAPSSSTPVLSYDNYLYVSGVNATYVYSISNPASMRLVNSLPFPIYSSAVIVNSTIYTSSQGGTNTINIYDLSNPADPVYLGGIPSHQPYTWGTAIANGYAYLGTGGGVEAYELGGINSLTAQGLQANGANLGSLTVAGDSSIQGSLTVGNGIQNSGFALFQDTTDSATAFSIQNASGTDLLGIDTANNLVRLGNTTYSTGTISQTTTTVTGSSTTFTAAMVGGTLIYPDGTSSIITGYTNSTTLIVSVSKTVSSGSAYQIQYGGFSVSGSGTALLQSTTNSTTAFQIQNSSGQALLTADTTTQTLTVQALVVSVSLTVNGHVITGNSSGSTTASVNVNAGSGSICTVTGDDTGGRITLTTGSSGWVSGVQCTINFSSSYSSAPNPVISIANGAGATTDISTVKPYVDSSTGNFTIDFTTADTATHKFYFNYFNAQ